MKQKWSNDNITFTFCAEEDLGEIASMLAKPEVCKHLFFGPNSKEETVAYFSPLVSSIENSLKEGKIPHISVFTIRERKSNDFIGQCALLPIDFTDGNYLIGYQIDDTQWRKGYGSAACEFLVYYAFDVLGAFRITGDCAKGNIASERTMLKAGFQLDGTQRRYWHHAGEFHDRLLFGLLKDDMPEIRIQELRDIYG